MKRLKSCCHRPANRCDLPQPVDLEARRVLDAGTSFGLIDDSAAALLQSVYVDGMTSTEAARRFRTAGHVLLSGAETLVERTDGIPKVGNRSEVPSPLSLDIGTDLAHARVQRSGPEHDPAEHRHQCDRQRGDHELASVEQ